MLRVNLEITPDQVKGTYLSQVVQQRVLETLPSPQEAIRDPVTLEIGLEVFNPIDEGSRGHLELVPLSLKSLYRCERKLLHLANPVSLSPLVDWCYLSDDVDGVHYPRYTLQNPNSRRRKLDTPLPQRKLYPRAFESGSGLSEKAKARNNPFSLPLLVTIAGFYARSNPDRLPALARYYAAATEKEDPVLAKFFSGEYRRRAEAALSYIEIFPPTPKQIALEYAWLYSCWMVSRHNGKPS